MIGNYSLNPIKRSLSIGVIGAFFIQSLGLAAPVVTAENALSLKAPDIPLSEVIQNPSKLRLPLEYASLKELHTGTNGKLIIHIQDAHSNYSGQMNMAQALEEMIGHTGIQTVLVEGSSGEVTLRETKKIADNKTWKIAANKMLLQGMIAGEEYLNLTTDLPIRLMGIEYQDMYNENLQSYARMVEQRQIVLEYLSVIERKLEVLKQLSYPEKLKEYEQKINGLDDDEFRQSYEVLMAFARQSDDPGLGEYPEIRKLELIKSIESEIDFEAANREQMQLVAELKTAGFKDDVSRILESTKKGKKSSDTQQGVLMSLMNLAESANLPVDQYLNLTVYQSYLESFSELKIDVLLLEINQYEDAFYRRVLEDEDARRVRILDRYTRLLRKAFEVKLSSDEFELLRINRPDFDTIEWQAFINRVILRDRGFEDAVPFEDVIDKAYDELFRFYEIVAQRDIAFLQNSGSVLENTGENAAFLIAGGYHTAHLTQLLRDQGYSYVVLTPFVEFETDHRQYEKVLLKTLEISETADEADADARLTDIENSDTVKIAGFASSAAVAASRLSGESVYGISASRLTNAVAEDVLRNEQGSRLSIQDFDQKISSENFQMLPIGRPQSFLIDKENQAVLTINVKSGGATVLTLSSLNPDLVQDLGFKVNSADYSIQQSGAVVNDDGRTLTLQSSALPENSLFVIGRNSDLLISIRSANKMKPGSGLSGRHLTLRLNSDGTENASLKDGAFDANGNPTASTNGTFAGSQPVQVRSQPAAQAPSALFKGNGEVMSESDLGDFRALPGVSEDTLKILRKDQASRGQKLTQDLILKIYSNEKDLVVQQFRSSETGLEPASEIVRFKDAAGSGLVFGRNLTQADYALQAPDKFAQKLISRQAFSLSRENQEWILRSSAQNLPYHLVDGEYVRFEESEEYRLGNGITGQLLRLRLAIQVNPSSVRNLDISGSDRHLFVTGLFDRNGNFVRPATRQEASDLQLSIEDGYRFYTIPFNKRVSRSKLDRLIDVETMARINGISDTEDPVLSGLDEVNMKLLFNYDLKPGHENTWNGSPISQISASQQLKILDHGPELLSESIEGIPFFSAQDAGESFLLSGARLSDSGSQFSRELWPVIGSSVIYDRLTKFLNSVKAYTDDVVSNSDRQLEQVSQRFKKSKRTVDAYFRDPAALGQYPDETRIAIEEIVSEFDSAYLNIQQEVYARNPIQAAIDSMDISERRWIEFVTVIARNGLTEHLISKAAVLAEGAATKEDADKEREAQALEAFKEFALSEASLTPAILRDYLALRDRYLESGRSLDSEFHQIRRAAFKLIRSGILDGYDSQTASALMVKAVINDLSVKDYQLSQYAASGALYGDTIGVSNGERLRIIGRNEKEVTVEVLNDNTDFKETITMTPQGFRDRIAGDAQSRLIGFASPQSQSIQLYNGSTFKFVVEETGFGSLKFTYRFPGTDRDVVEIFDQDKIIVGRIAPSPEKLAYTNDIALLDEYISRTDHLIFERINGQWMVSSASNNRPSIRSVRIARNPEPLFADASVFEVSDIAVQEDGRRLSDLQYAEPAIIEQLNGLSPEVLNSWNLIQNLIRAVAGNVSGTELDGLLQQTISYDLIITSDIAETFLRVRQDFLDAVSRQDGVDNHPFKAILDRAAETQPQVKSVRQLFFGAQLIPFIETLSDQGSRLAGGIIGDPFLTRRQAAKEFVDQLQTEFEGITDAEIFEAISAPKRNLFDQAKARFNPDLKRKIQIENRIAELAQTLTQKFDDGIGDTFFQDILRAQLAFPRLVELNKPFKIIQYFFRNYSEIMNSPTPHPMLASGIPQVVFDGYMTGRQGKVEAPNLVYVAHLRYLIEQAGPDFFDSGAENARQNKLSALAESDLNSLEAWENGIREAGGIRYLTEDVLKDLQKLIDRINPERYRTVAGPQNIERIQTLQQSLKQSLNAELNLRKVSRANNISDLYVLNPADQRRSLSREEVSALVAVLYAVRESPQIQRDIERKRADSSVKAYKSILSTGSPSLTPKIARAYLKLTAGSQGMQRLLQARKTIIDVIQSDILSSARALGGQTLEQEFGVTSSENLGAFDSVFSGSKKQLLKQLFEPLSLMPQQGDVLVFSRSDAERLGIQNIRSESIALKLTEVTSGAVTAVLSDGKTQISGAVVIQRSVLEPLITSDAFVSSRNQGSRLSAVSTGNDEEPSFDSEAGYRMLLEQARLRWGNSLNFSEASLRSAANNLYMKLIQSAMTQFEVSVIFFALAEGVNPDQILADRSNIPSVVEARIGSLKEIDPAEGYRILLEELRNSGRTQIEPTQTNQNLYKISGQLYLKLTAAGITSDAVRKLFSDLISQADNYGELVRSLNAEFYDFSVAPGNLQTLNVLSDPIGSDGNFLQPNLTAEPVAGERLNFSEANGETNTVEESSDDQKGFISGSRLSMQEIVSAVERSILTVAAKRMAVLQGADWQNEEEIQDQVNNSSHPKHRRIKNFKPFHLTHIFDLKNREEFDDEHGTVSQMYAKAKQVRGPNDIYFLPQIQENAYYRPIMLYNVNALRYLPSDSATSYNQDRLYVRVPEAFGSTSLVSYLIGLDQNNTSMPISEPISNEKFTKIPGTDRVELQYTDGFGKLRRIVFNNFNQPSGSRLSDEKDGIVRASEIAEGGRLNIAGSEGEDGGIIPDSFFSIFGVEGWNSEGIDLDSLLTEQAARTIASSELNIAIPTTSTDAEILSVGRTSQGLLARAGLAYNRLFERGAASAIPSLSRALSNPIASVVEAGVSLGKSFTRIRDPKVTRVTREVLSRVKGKDNQPVDMGALVLVADGLNESGNILDVLQSKESRTQFLDALDTWKAGISFAEAYNGTFVVQLQTPQQSDDESDGDYQARIAEYNEQIQPILNLIQDQGFLTEISDTSKAATFIIPHNTVIGSTFDNGSGDSAFSSITAYESIQTDLATGEVKLPDTTKSLVFAGAANLRKAAELAGNPQPFNPSALSSLSALFGQNVETVLNATQTSRYTQEVKTSLADFLFTIQAVWSDIKAQILQRAATVWAA